MDTSPETNELAAALAKAQGAFTVPKKSHTATVPTKAGGQYSYTYSTLDELIEATRPALVANGLSAVQNVSTPDGGTVAVTTRLLHAAGQWIQFDAIVLPSGGTPQAVGAAITYARRYSLGAALNVAAEEDDDAASLQPRPAARAASRPAPEPTTELPPHEPKRPPAASPANYPLISEAQAKRFFAIAKGAGWESDDLAGWLKATYHVDSSRQIARRDYETICADVADGPRDWER